jgi:hypothetical protein
MEVDMKAMTVDASVLKRSQIERHAATSERIVAFGLILLSLSGTYIGLLNGALVWRGDMFILAVFWQLVVSAFQFIHVRNWQSAWYLVPLLLSVAPTAAGYGALLGAYIASVLAGWGIPSPMVGAYAIILLASLGIDIIPERILVKRG